MISDADKCLIQKKKQNELEATISHFFEVGPLEKSDQRSEFLLQKKKMSGPYI